MVKSSWSELISKYNLQKFGVILFKQIFKIAPETQGMFPFRDVSLEDLLKNQSFRRHAFAVANALDQSIHRIESLNNGDAILKDLGKKHIKFGVKEEHYPVIGQAIVTTMKMGLQSKFTSDVKESWVKLYKLVSQAMISDNYLKSSTNEDDGPGV